MQETIFFIKYNNNNTVFIQPLSNRNDT